MRIGLFTDTYTPDINGVVTSVVTLQNALEALGHEVYIVTNQPSLLNTSYENNVLRLPGVELKFLYGYIMSSPIHIQALRVIKEMELDVIHVHSEFGIGMFARSAAKQLHIPLVSTYHTTYEDYTHYVNLLGLKSVDSLSKIAVAKISRVFTKQSQIVIAPSEKTKKMLLGYEIKKEISVIPTGLDLQRFQKRDGEALDRIRNKHNIIDSVTTFVYIGRLAKEKSIDVVINSIASLIKQEPNVKLLIVGGGPSDDELKAQAKRLGIEENVDFVGPVASDEVVNYYHVSDAFISASLTETQGLTYIEALACGICVFARPDRPLDGIIVDQETGYLFESEEEFTTKAVKFIRESNEERQLMHSNALAKASTFGSEKFALDVLEVYTKAIDIYFGRYSVVAIDELENGQWKLVVNSKESQETFMLDDFIMERREIKVGDEMSRVELSEMEDDQQVYEAYQLALKRIGLRDYTSFEMSDYLRAKFDLSENQINVVIDLLKKRRFINDERYFRDKVDYHREQLRGNQRIIDDLTKRGFDRIEIEEALSKEPYEDYLERGSLRAQNYYNTIRDGSRQQRYDRVSQHLIRQGYEYSIVREILDTIKDDYDLESEKSSLEEVIRKAWMRYSRRSESKREVKNKVVRYVLGKGYDYDLVKEVIEEYEHED
ncbi:glycosyltransferase [Erysipelothrix sp. HDW6A]|uniref:glycosyltransferase n=1 Tax=Erysipelothrix sp. HDW6A TaxID=2714928 RepID=UPI00140E2670|nr:RecX family transcriptional regulator [Erysipelothrix sp. HDW6A]QIK57595.1 glycosyltransferase [Erysipelothrix sp. HDW6A]